MVPIEFYGRAGVTNETQKDTTMIQKYDKIQTVYRKNRQFFVYEIQK